MLLSICVISHNQREQLKRCVNSILTQNIPFEYEVIISDDASSDGTYELASKYAQLHKNVYAYQCNTDDYNSSNSSSRSGWNRCNAVQHAIGKYVAFVDGDDFFYPGKNIYKEQVALLEKHPECSCCMANDYMLYDGQDVNCAFIRHKELFANGEVISAKKYIQNTFRESHCFVYRRRTDIDYSKTMGGFLVDNCLTAFHIQFGDIICLNDAGYIYVQYKNSIWHDYEKNYDYIVLGCPALFCAELVPALKPIYWSSAFHMKKIRGVVAAAIREKPMTVNTLRWMSNFDNYLFHAFNRQLTINDKIHLFFVYILLYILELSKKTLPLCSSSWRLLDKVL